MANLSYPTSCYILTLLTIHLQRRKGGFLCVYIRGKERDEDMGKGKRYCRTLQKILILKVLQNSLGTHRRCTFRRRISIYSFANRIRLES